jgi:hypothetical protein
MQSEALNEKDSHCSRLRRAGVDAVCAPCNEAGLWEWRGPQPIWTAIDACYHGYYVGDSIRQACLSELWSKFGAQTVFLGALFAVIVNIRSRRKMKETDKTWDGLSFYEVHLRKDKCGVDLISDALPFGRLWYDGPSAVSNAIGYAEHRSRSHDAVIRVYDSTGNVIEMHEQGRFFKEWW